jgi:hypothetical protein
MERAVAVRPPEDRRSLAGAHAEEGPRAGDPTNELRRLAATTRTASRLSACDSAAGLPAGSPASSALTPLDRLKVDVAVAYQYDYGTAIYAGFNTDPQGGPRRATDRVSSSSSTLVWSPSDGDVFAPRSSCDREVGRGYGADPERAPGCGTPPSHSRTAVADTFGSACNKRVCFNAFPREGAVA